MPNITGDQGLLAGNALMFSSRFLLMSLGAALGGWASARFGYKSAFIINAVSFLVSAYSIWLIPSEKMLEENNNDDESESVLEKRRGRTGASFWTDLQEGWKYIARYPLVMALMGLNILWATGGGACN